MVIDFLLIVLGDVYGIGIRFLLNTFISSDMYTALLNLIESSISMMSIGCSNVVLRILENL